MIDTPGGLRSLVERAGQQDSIALDTEFVWERTYYPKLGLVQLALSEEECYLIDAVSLSDLAPLGELIAAPELVKIFHDAPQDLIILRRATGAFPRAIFDTRCAAGLASLSSTISLSELVAQLLGVELAKSASRTNWRQRPLAPEQIVYAVEDVRYLPAIRQELLARIRHLGRETWLQEELAAFDDPALYAERDPWQQYLRVKGMGCASPRELAILRELAAWREEEARRCDRPRERVVADAVLVRLARARIRTAGELRALPGLARRYHAEVLKRISQGLAVAKGDCPRLRHSPDEERLKAQLERALAYLRRRSQAEGIDAPFVATRAELKSLIGDGPDAAPERHRLLRGWRRSLVGEELLALLADGRHRRPESTADRREKGKK